MHSCSHTQACTHTQRHAHTGLACVTGLSYISCLERGKGPWDKQAKTPRWVVLPVRPCTELARGLRSWGCRCVRSPAADLEMRISQEMPGVPGMQ